MTALLSLAERAEALTGPDREVDAWIAQHILFKLEDWPTHLEIKGDGYFKFTMPDGDHWSVSPSYVPTYTASIDAAMMLVPEEHNYGVGRDDIVTGPVGWAWVSGKRIEYQLVRAATPALALCAAALRARAQA